jgi:hypothetical protein
MGSTLGLFDSSPVAGKQNGSARQVKVKESFCQIKSRDQG